MTQEMTEREAALAARIKELEAAQAPPAKGSGGPISLAAAIVSIVPRWLVAAAGVLLLAWLSFDLYMSARLKMAQTQATEAVKTQEEIKRDALKMPAARVDF